MENINIELDKLKEHLIKIGVKSNVLESTCNKEIDDLTLENIESNTKCEQQTNEPTEDVLKNPLHDIEERVDYFIKNKTKWMLEQIENFNDGIIRCDIDVDSEREFTKLENEFKLVADECVELKQKIDTIYKLTQIPIKIRICDIEKLIFKIEHNIFRIDNKYKHILLDSEIMDILDELRDNYCDITENKKYTFHAILLKEAIDEISPKLCDIINISTNNRNYFNDDLLKSDVLNIKNTLNKMLKEIN